MVTITIHLCPHDKELLSRKQIANKIQHSVSIRCSAGNWPDIEPGVLPSALVAEALALVVPPRARGLDPLLVLVLVASVVHRATVLIVVPDGAPDT